MTPSAKPHTGRARHPRSRVERALLTDLESRLKAALELCETSAADDILFAEGFMERAQHIEDIVEGGARHAAAGSMERAQHIEDIVSATERAQQIEDILEGGSSASTEDSLVDPIPNARTRPPPAPEPDRREPAQLEHRHYDLPPLGEFISSMTLGPLRDYLPAQSHPEESNARSRFDALLSRVQQHQLARTVQSELRTREPDAMWNWEESRYHLAPVTRLGRPVDEKAWTAFIRAGGDPIALGGCELEIVPNVNVRRAPFRG